MWCDNRRTYAIVLIQFGRKVRKKMWANRVRLKRYRYKTPYKHATTHGVPRFAGMSPTPLQEQGSQVLRQHVLCHLVAY